MLLECPHCNEPTVSSAILDHIKAPRYLECPNCKRPVGFNPTALPYEKIVVGFGFVPFLIIFICFLILSIGIDKPWSKHEPFKQSIEGIAHAYVVGTSLRKSQEQYYKAHKEAKLLIYVSLSLLVIAGFVHVLLVIKVAFWDIFTRKEHLYKVRKPYEPAKLGDGYLKNTFIAKLIQSRDQYKDALDKGLSKHAKERTDLEASISKVDEEKSSIQSELTKKEFALRVKEEEVNELKAQQKHIDETEEQLKSVKSLSTKLEWDNKLLQAEIENLEQAYASALVVNEHVTAYYNTKGKAKHIVVKLADELMEKKIKELDGQASGALKLANVATLRRIRCEGRECLKTFHNTRLIELQNLIIAVEKRIYFIEQQYYRDLDVARKLEQTPKWLIDSLTWMRSSFKDLSNEDDIRTYSFKWYALSQTPDFDIVTVPEDYFDQEDVA